VIFFIQFLVNDQIISVQGCVLKSVRERRAEGEGREERGEGEGEGRGIGGEGREEEREKGRGEEGKRGRKRGGLPFPAIFGVYLRQPRGRT
jgi:hypothetical protein